MHPRSTRLALASAAALSLAACADQPAAVRTTPTASGPALSSTAESGGTYLVGFRGNSVPANFASRVAELGGTVVFAHGGAGIAAVAGLGPDAAAALGSSAGVSAIAADQEVLLDPVTMSEPEGEAVESAAAPATAFFFPRQWHMRAIGAHTAWSAGILGSPSVKVGILDTGIGYTHADLVGRVDFALSRSFVPSEDVKVAANFPGAHPIADLHYHGTHVAATVASNAIAAAGVTSGVTLVGLKVCTSGSAPAFTASCPTSGTLAAIAYAADNGLDVINMSLGGSFNRRDASARGGDGPSFIAIVNRVMAYANRNGVTVVVSAGNSNADLDNDGNSYKSYCSAPHVICVSATGPTSSAGTNGPWVNVDAKATYSNYGSSAVSVAAPGGNTGGSVSAACSRFSLAIPVCRTGTFVVGISGTSMASPHVAGLAALVAERVGRRPAQVRAAIQNSADDLGAPDVDPIYGHGRINVARALGL
jgi:lantibiotic leader peptide-processing serine protease